jgi:hypothetical protein
METRSFYSLTYFYMKKKDYTVTIIVVVGLFILTLMLIVAIGPERGDIQPVITFTHKAGSTAPMAYSGREHIQVIDQNVTAGKVIILSAALKENGYVVIHKEEKGKPGPIIGVSNMIAPGLYSNRSVVLTEGVAQGDILYAMLHADNGDGIFTPKDDAPVNGDEMMMMSGSNMIKFVAI